MPVVGGVAGMPTCALAKPANRPTPANARIHLRNFDLCLGSFAWRAVWPAGDAAPDWTHSTSGLSLESKGTHATCEPFSPATAVVVSDPFLAAVPVLEERGIKVVTVEQLLAADPIDTVETGEDDVALMQLTSGSTGSPKAVVITHRNVLRTYDFGEVGGVSFITMEYVRGMTLRYLLQNRSRVPAAAGLLEQLPEQLKNSPEAKVLGTVADRKVFNIIHLIYRARNYEGHSKDYEFSRASMEEHWRAGYHDARRTLRHREILEQPKNLEGLFTFDLVQDSRE